MSDTQTAREKIRKTPGNATDFEREQLRFFLSQGDLATTLATLNPSLAWLPVLSEMKLVENERQLVAWIERNFADATAVRDVVANLRFFGPDTANLLEHYLSAQAERLPAVLVNSWRLIIRQMQAAREAWRNEWFAIAARVRRGEKSGELLERIAEVLRPKLRVSRSLSFDGRDTEVLEHPRQLMSIDFEVDDGIDGNEVISAWPKDAEATTDARLLSGLTDALITALEDATEVGSEGDEGYGVSDSDVPSVAEHPQNQYRTGFHPIVRVIAELWERLSAKSSKLAILFVDRWQHLPFRLTRRLGLFACASPVVPVALAAGALIALPQGELFLTGSTVEVVRLLRARWNEFELEQRDVILHRICEGPPKSWYRDDVDSAKHIDRARFDLLGEMKRSGLGLNTEAEALLEDLDARWPQWTLRPAEQAGFHMWMESGSRSAREGSAFEGVPDDQLVVEATRVAGEREFSTGDDWHTLCLNDPDRALHGLEFAAQAGNWPAGLWHQLLWSRKEYRENTTEPRIAALLLQCPADSFGQIASEASWWLDEHARTLESDSLWPLWDRVAEGTLAEKPESSRG